MRTISLFILVFFIVSCQKKENKLNGFWLKSNNHERRTDFEAFQIKNDSIKLFYEVNVNEIHPYEIIDSFMLIGVNSELKVPFKRLANDTLFFDNANFLLESIEEFRNKHEIELINFSTGIEQTFEDSLFRFNKFGLRSSDSLELILGDRLSSINDLPLLINCHHCRPFRKNCIFIDESALLSDLKEVYNYLYLMNERRVILVTKVECGKFEGVSNRINMFDEDLKRFPEKTSLRFPSLPPSVGISNKNFKRFDYLEIRNKLKSIEDLTSFKFIHCKKKNCLIEVNSDLASMEEFLILKTNQHKLRLAELEELSQMKFKKSYNELGMPDKRIVAKDLNNVLIILI